MAVSYVYSLASHSLAVQNSNTIVSTQSSAPDMPFFACFILEINPPNQTSPFDHLHEYNTLPIPNVFVPYYRNNLNHA